MKKYDQKENRGTTIEEPDGASVRSLEEKKAFYRTSQGQLELFIQFCEGNLSCTEDEFLEYSGIVRATDFDKRWK